MEVSIEKIEELIEYYNSKNIHNEAELVEVIKKFNLDDEDMFILDNFDIELLTKRTKEYYMYLVGVSDGYRGRESE